jgi:hypothetical protein
MIFALLPIVIIALAALAYAWFATAKELRAASAPRWRQTITLAGLLASTALVPLPYLVSSFVDPHKQSDLEWTMRCLILLFVLSLAGALVQKGPLLKIGLVLFSIFFLGFTWFIYIMSQWQF